MPPPSHSPNCRKIACYPTECPECGKRVFFWACTCGSGVFFDKLGKPWPEHPCTKNNAGDQSYSSFREPPPLKNIELSAYSYTEMQELYKKMKMVKCRYCGVLLNRKNIASHLRKNHLFHFKNR